MDVSDYDKLLTLGTDLGRLLMASGAEIFRVEESVNRLMSAYGLEPQVFAIPNCLIVSLTTPRGHPITRMYRIPAHGTDIELLERCNQLCRQLCQAPPPVEEAQALVDALPRRRTYPAGVVLTGHVMAASFFALFLGGGLEDGFAAAFSGLAVSLLMLYGQRLTGSNLFFRTAVSAAAASGLALMLVRAGVGNSVEAVTIGPLMLLVPGMALTNAMREIMGGDIISGVNRTAEVLLVAAAIALGSALPVLVARSL